MWPLSGKEIFEIIYNKPPDDNFFHHIHIDGVLTDSRRIPNASTTSEQNDVGIIPLLFVAICGEKYDGHAYLKECFERGVALALVDRHSTYLKDLQTEHLKRCLLVDDVVSALNAFAREFRKSFSFPVIGVGGSNGKTTTKEILASFLSFDDHKITKTEKSENGFLGIAITLLQQKHNCLNPPNALVLEIGIDTLGAMEKHVHTAQPNIVLLTALGPEHLTGLNNWETAVKEELILFSTPGCKRVWQLNDLKIYDCFLEKTKNGNFLTDMMDDILVIDSKDKHKLSDYVLQNIQTIFWNIRDITPKSLTIQIESHLRKGTFLLQENIPLSGKHNASNFALAFGAAIALGHTKENIMQGFQNFVPPPQRSKISYFPDDTILFDDTYNASPASVSAALDMLCLPDWHDKNKILVLGDMLELGDESKFWHENLFFHFKKLDKTHLCLFGSAMYNCYRLFKESDEDFFKGQCLTVDWLDDQMDPAEFLKKMPFDLKGAIILVKGSRGMRLERFVRCVEKIFS